MVPASIPPFVAGALRAPMHWRRRRPAAARGARLLRLTRLARLARPRHMGRLHIAAILLTPREA